MNLKEKIDRPIFHTIGAVADEMGQPCYIVGGYVRDLFLERPSKDIDFVTVGSGIALAERLAERLGQTKQLTVFSNFGTCATADWNWSLSGLAASHIIAIRASR